MDASGLLGVNDDYYRRVFSRNSLDDNGTQMISTAHFGKNYNNAFWNGVQITYGDGTTTFRELSGGLDVATHEFTHGVTEFTSDLVYQGESGALNEAFSDVLGNSSEFYAAQNGLDRKVGPDWQIGEDVYLPKVTVAGFRNMADPAEDGDPDHYSELYTGNQDSGGVHSNSGIPNHPHTGPRVTSIGLSAAEQIFYAGFTSLPSTATMSEARATTVAVAGGLYGEGSVQQTSTADAWEAVGVKQVD